MRVLRSRLTTVLPYFPGLQVATALSRSAPVRALPRSPEQGPRCFGSVKRRAGSTGGWKPCGRLSANPTRRPRGPACPGAASMDARCSTRRGRTGRGVYGLLTVAKVLRRVAEQGAGGGERNQAERTEG